MKDLQYLKLKAELLVEGIQATPEALKGMGKKYKEQNHGLFGWDFEDHAGMVLPDDFLLPDGTVVQFRKNGRSPYRVTVEENGFMLSSGKEGICMVEWIPRIEEANATPWAWFPAEAATTPFFLNEGGSWDNLL